MRNDHREISRGVNGGKRLSGTASPGLQRFVFALVVFVCSVLIALIMMWGNPILWITQEQQKAYTFDEGIEREDYDFLTDLASSTGQTEPFVVWGEYLSIAPEEDVGRDGNLATAAQELNGYEIEPGEELSVNNVLGDVSQDDRYLVAEIVDGYETKRERGGGIGQVASALYIAALEADLEITERHPHKVVCDYVPLGLDAAVSYGHIDLKIKNTTDAPLYLRALAQGQTVIVRLYGIDRERAEDVQITSEIVETYDRPIEDVTERELVDTQATFHTVESYRVYYHDGSELRRSLVSTDPYLISPEISQ